MDKKTNISDSELEVLKELWLLPSLTARLLTDRLLERTNWSEPTIKTLLLRLLRKNAVKRTRSGKVFVYSALITQDEYRYQAGCSLLNRLWALPSTGGISLPVKKICLLRHTSCGTLTTCTLQLLLPTAT